MDKFSRKTQLLNPTEESVEIEGTLDRYLFHNEESGWSVVKIVPKKRGQTFTAVGDFFGVYPGEHLKLSGRWIKNKEYGAELQVTSYLSIMPGTLKGIEKYLGSGMIPGVGKEMARRLVEAFGLKIIDIMESDPLRLMRVSGIGEVRMRQIHEGWLKHRDIKDVMIFLQTVGISPAYAARIYKTYGRSCVPFIKEDPYRLATDIFGIGFKSADKIAHQLGIPKDSAQRARAGILYVLGQITDKGHVCCPLPSLMEAAAEELDIERIIIENALYSLADDENIQIETRSAETFVYLRPLYVSETGAARFLDDFLQGSPINITINIEKATQWFEERHRMELAEEQREALGAAIREKALIITGGPGTGKTTLIRAVIEILEKKDQRIALAAPTGRAAKRMSEATGRPAKTIHRLLEFNPGEQGFDRNQNKPLKLDLLILDEVSMVDIVLFYHVLKALPTHARLILVGDADQLPSVGPGSVLADVIESHRIRTIHLAQIFRQARQSLIVVNAHRVNQGQMPFAQAQFGRQDFEFLQHEDAETALEAIRELVARTLPKRLNISPLDIQILTPMHKGQLGVFNLNLVLQGLLNPGAKGIFRAGHKLCVGDKVMQVKNNYDLGVFNGDMGRILEIDEDGKELAVDFDGRRVEFDASNLDELTLAYACSIHKSQGSEYPAVIIALHTQHYVMLQRNLIYTAITRGKRFVSVVGSPRALSMAVRNVNRSQRYSLLRHRLEGLL